VLRSMPPRLRVIRNAERGWGSPERP
jgi:hypothetical protein